MDPEVTCEQGTACPCYQHTRWRIREAATAGIDADHNLARFATGRVWAYKYATTVARDPRVVAWRSAATGQPHAGLAFKHAPTIDVGCGELAPSRGTPARRATRFAHQWEHAEALK